MNAKRAFVKYKRQPNRALVATSYYYKLNLGIKTCESSAFCCRTNGIDTETVVKISYPSHKRIGPQ